MDIKTLNVENGDTLIIEVDIAKYDIEAIERVFNRIAKLYPNNQIIPIPMGMIGNIRVVKGENRITFDDDYPFI